MQWVLFLISIIGGLATNLVLGVLVADLIDNPRHDLRHWLRQAPHALSLILVLELWPLLLFSVHTRWRSN